MITSPDQDPTNAWGVMYQVGVLESPKAYLSTTSRAFLCKDGDRLRVEMVAGALPWDFLSRKNRKGDLVEVWRKVRSDSVKVRAVRGRARVKEPVETGSSAFLIDLRKLGLTVALELFCDERLHPQLCEIDNHRYRIISLIGRGAYADVYRALSLSGHHHEFCAIKVEKRSREERLPFEYELLTKLRHVSIIGVGKFFQGRANNFFEMPIGEGGSLQQRLLHHHPPVDDRAARHIFRQVLAGLAYIHSCEIVHRDLKSENIVLTSSSDSICGAKIIDFGLSCYEGDRDEMLRCTGSPRYMAPEILHNLRRHKQRIMLGKNIDVWSLGVCAFLALTKKYPFKYRNIESQYYMVMGNLMTIRDTRVYQSLGLQAQGFIDQCFVADNTKRPQADELILHEWISNTPGNSNSVAKC